ncbi:Small ubiquitin-related modifier [Halotydeus destructor]|nr:Small ubiquitin-related modifier [Halotydeus destructor]
MSSSSGSGTREASPQPGSSQQARDEGADVKPNIASNSLEDYIMVKVVAQDGREIHVNLKKSTKMEKLMKCFCNRTNSSMQDLRFHYDGKRLNKEQTVESLEIESGDTIEVYQNQSGGFKSP